MNVFSNRRDQVPESGGSGGVGKILWTFVGVVLVVGVVFLAVLTFIDTQNANLDDMATSTLQQAGPPLAGSLALSLLPKDTALQKPEGFATGYLHSLTTGILQPIQDTLLYSVQHGFSPDATKVAFYGRESDEEDISDPYTVNQHVYTGVLNRAAASVTDIVQVSDYESFAKLTPEISPDGFVLFSALDEPNPTAIDPRFADITLANEWNIFLAREDEEAVVLTEGIYPHWITASEFVFLKNDGLYRYNIAEDNEAKILILAEGEVASNSMIDVSPSGSVIVWTVPETGSMYVLRLLEVPETGTVEIFTHGVVENSVFAFWPAISPDEAYVALQTFDPEVNAILNDPQPRIVFYDLQTLQKLSQDINLNAFEQLEMYLTDWI